MQYLHSQGVVLQTDRGLPPSISDGLILPCAICGKEKIQFDYTVTDELWRVVVPYEMRQDVICLPCLDKLSEEKGADLGANIVCLQFTGQGITIKFIPHSVYYYQVGCEAAEPLIKE